MTLTENYYRVCQGFTVSFMDLDLGSKVIIFESILSPFESSFIFWDSWDSSKNWLVVNIEPPLENLACQNQWNTL
jgi:hypothetical protein